MIICGTASASPDLVVTSVNVTSNVSPGSTVTINDTVTNQGDQAGGFTVGYYIQDEYAVVKKPANQRNASIYGDKVVWSDYRYDRADSDLYFKNLTGTENGYISSLDGNQSNPAIYGDIIVWQDDTFGHWQILGYKIPDRDDPIVENIYILNSTTYAQINPAIYEDKIVWQQQRSDGKWDIYLYDFSISSDVAMAKGKWTVQITKDGANHINPYVNGNYIVWQQDNGDGIWNIYTYDLSTGDINRVCQSSENQTNPALYGDNIVWQQYNTTGKNWDIYMYDLSKDPADAETQITNNTYNQINPAIYGDKLVWQDNRNGNWDIYMYDLTLGIERQLTTNTRNQIDPAIYDNKVVWTDDRNGNEDIYMTDDLTLEPEYTRYISGLAAGKSNSALTNITLPSDLKANVNYYIIVMADAAYDNSISESNENNNIKISSAMIVPDVDLTMPSISGPATAQTGGSMIVVNTVKNTGTKNSNPFHVYFYLSKDGTTLDKYLGKRSISGGLKAGASSIAYTNLTIPSNIFGSYYIVAVIDPLNETCETNKLNNIVASLTTTNIIAPDLVITSVSTGSTKYQRGDKITVQTTVKNQGSNISKGFYVYCYLSKDSNITTSDTPIGSRYISGLGAGASDTNSINFTILNNLSGSYYIGAIVDPTNKVFESNESNNILASPTSINVVLPDLAATSVNALSTSYRRGTTMTVKNTVKNQGKVTSGGFYVNIYLYKNYKGKITSIYLGRQYFSSVGAGASKTAYTKLTIKSTTPKGLYYCKMVVDPSNSVAESNKSNNAISSGTWINIF